MKKQFLHLLISNNLITALRITENGTDILFSNIPISYTEKIFDCLLPYHHLPIRLILDTVNVSIKPFDIAGMSWWHRHELMRRLKHESSSSDWQCHWQKNQNLILMTGMFSEFEHDFLRQFIIQKFLIEHAVPSLWILSQTLLKGHKIQQNGIVQIPLQESFQQVLYLNNTPTIARLSKDTNVLDWLQFVQTKYKISLDVLDISELITSSGNTNDSFATYISNQLVHHKSPKIIFSKKIPLNNYYQRFNLLKQAIQGLIAATAIAAVIKIPYMFEAFTTEKKLDTLTKQEQMLSDQLPINSPMSKAIKSYMDKRSIIENFNNSSFPVMFFLEKISKIAPNYGHIIFVRIEPPTPQFTENLRGEFSVHLRLIPFKNQKDLKQLTTELHKVFGTNLRVHVINSPITTQKNESKPLKYSIQINMTGLIHDIQKLQP